MAITGTELAEELQQIFCEGRHIQEQIFDLEQLENGRQRYRHKPRYWWR